MARKQKQLFNPLQKFFQMNTVIEKPLQRKGILSETSMRWYLGGQLVSLTGSLLQSAVLALLIVSITSKAEAGTWTGVIWALGLLPGTFFGPFSGVLLDRHDKRKILIMTGVIGALQATTLAWLTYTNTATLANILGLALINGFINAIDGPGRNAIVKDIVVDKQNIRQASKTFSSLYNLAQIAGPGFAGYLVLHFGYSFTFLLNALSFVVLIVSLVSVKLTTKLETSGGSVRSSIWREVVEGGKYTFSDPGIRLSILLTTGVCVFGFSYNVLLAVINKYLLHGSEITYSHLAVSGGVGSFAGALLAMTLGDRISHKTFVIGGLTCSGAALILLHQTTNIHLAMVFVFMAGLGFMSSFSSLRASMMHIVKQEKTGIMLGFAFSFFFGGMMTCSLTLGYLADKLGLAFVLETAGIALLVLAAVTPFLPGIDELE